MNNKEFLKTYLRIFVILLLYTIFHLLLIFCRYLYFVVENFFFATMPAIIILIHLGFYSCKKMFDFKSTMKLYILSVGTIFVLTPLLAWLAFPKYMSPSWQLVATTIPAAIFLLISFLLLYFFLIFKKKYIKKCYISPILGQILLYSLLLFISVEYVSYEKSMIIKNRSFLSLLDKFHFEQMYTIKEFTSKSDSFSSKIQIRQTEDFMKDRLLYPNFGFNLNDIDTQYDIMLSFLYLEKLENRKKLFKTVSNRIEYAKRKKYYYCLFYNSLPPNYDFSRLLKFDIFSESTVEIPDLQQYVQNKYSDKELLVLMQRFIKNLIDYHEFDLYAYLFLIDMYYQEGNIKEAIEYYNTAVSLKIPENFVKKNIEIIETENEKIKKLNEIYDDTVHSEIPLIKQGNYDTAVNLEIPEDYVKKNIEIIESENEKIQKLNNIYDDTIHYEIPLIKQGDIVQEIESTKKKIIEIYGSLLQN